MPANYIPKIGRIRLEGICNKADVKSLAYKLSAMESFLNLVKKYFIEQLWTATSLKLHLPSIFVLIDW